MRACPRPSPWSAPSVTLKADCRSRTHTRAKWSTLASAISSSAWTSTKAGRAAGTPCARCGCFAGQAPWLDAPLSSLTYAGDLLRLLNPCGRERLHFFKPKLVSKAADDDGGVAEDEAGQDAVAAATNLDLNPSNRHPLPALGSRLDIDALR